jgi:glycyl-tRNA synthetase beta chain
MPKKKTRKLNDILLEIGTEPLPSDFVYSAIKQLKENTQNTLKEKKIIYDELEAFDTYRRLVILIKNVEEYQLSEPVEIRGPAKDLAFDENDKPTKAYYGFLKKTKLKEIDINIKKTDQGEYLFGLKKKPAKKVKVLLKDVLKEIIDSVNCSQNMHWGTDYQFIRPIRWILALYNDKKIDFDIAGVVADKFTYGHRILYPKKIKIKDIDDYFKKLEKHNVVLDFHKRRNKITKSLKAIAQGKKLQLVEDKTLLDEVCNLCEYPTLLSGRFDQEHLQLPNEVIQTSLKAGQKLFSLKDKKGNIKNFFIGVIDNKVSPSVKRKISTKYKNILDAKLKDSMFFLNQDTRTSLEDKVDNLKDVIFHKDLGSIYEKAERIKELSSSISKQLDLSKRKKEIVARCAHLAKADLVTQMVAEFPQLEGLIGYKYALISKEDREVAEGIRQHYLPKSADDRTPESLPAAVISVSDKLDTLCSLFSIGVVPSGSYDPYALRRNALGLIRIILDKRFSLSLDRLMTEDLRLIKKVNKNVDEEKTKNEVKNFIKQRLRQILTQDISENEIIDAVLASDFDDFLDVENRIKQLIKISKSKKFFNACKVVERTNNILKDAPGDLPKVKTRLFKEELEEQLQQIYKKSKVSIEEKIEKKKYKEATEE